jgi:hypothetical protein
VTVTDQQTKQDFAEQMRELVDVYFPHATLISVVLDNLNTHSPASVYATFASAEAKRILNKLEFRSTPKHGSWLNMAELEFTLQHRNASTGDSPVRPMLNGKWPPGKPNGMRAKRPSHGALPLPRRARSWRKRRIHGCQTMRVQIVQHHTDQRRGEEMHVYQLAHLTREVLPIRVRDNGRLTEGPL